MNESTHYSHSACTQPGELNALRWDDLDEGRCAALRSAQYGIDLTVPNPGAQRRQGDNLKLQLSLKNWLKNPVKPIPSCTVRMDFRDRGERVCTGVD